MIYVLAYTYRDVLVIANNEKKQFIGSKYLHEIISMLPAYEENRVKVSIISVPSLIDLFKWTENLTHKRNVSGKIIFYKEIKEDYQKRINIINFQETNY